MSKEMIDEQFQSNKHYKIPSLDVLDNKMIVDIITHFEMYQLPRLEKLNAYYLNQNPTINKEESRRNNPDKADHRAPHGFAYVITDFHVSYLVGIPIKVETAEESINAYIQEFNERNDIDLHHSNLATDLSKFGRGFELIHYDGDEQNLYLSNPYWTIVIYDESIEMRPLAAIRFPKVERENGSKYYITVYTAENITQYEPCNLVESELIEESRIANGFKHVPIVEYSNNRFRLGDYERVLSKIDLYDASQSDTANYMTDTNDAILVISGDFDATSIRYDKDTNALLLESGTDVNGNQTSLDARYIFKQYDVAGLESYKKRIEQDIHKFSNTPDLNDQNFSGTQSGVAIKYKLFALEQARSIKERVFARGLAMRYRLVNEMSKSTSDFTEDFGRLKFTFTPNLPESIVEELETFASAGGRISNKSLLSQLSFVTDVEEEIKKLDEESKELSRQAFSLPDSFRE